ncbi:MAG: hypothetical protein EZS28_000271 [Streblomastix strix]|uniref:Uncharacterized protein n=1 Tax=Streblomastix strix TaxID=222440 RepID=A0A5J4XCG2_9EUKA|nr:MAG: hypothetical protein EZS28_000271 [Streblomastix strix]
MIVRPEYLVNALIVRQTFSHTPLKIMLKIAGIAQTNAPFATNEFILKTAQTATSASKSAENLVDFIRAVAHGNFFGSTADGRIYSDPTTAAKAATSARIDSSRSKLDQNYSSNFDQNQSSYHVDLTEDSSDDDNYNGISSKNEQTSSSASTKAKQTSASKVSLANQILNQHSIQKSNSRVTPPITVQTVGNPPRITSTSSSSSSSSALPKPKPFIFAEEDEDYSDDDNIQIDNDEEQEEQNDDNDDDKQMKMDIDVIRDEEKNNEQSEIQNETNQLLQQRRRRIRQQQQNRRNREPDRKIFLTRDPAEYETSYQSFLDNAVVHRPKNMQIHIQPKQDTNSRSSTKQEQTSKQHTSDNIIDITSESNITSSNSNSSNTHEPSRSSLSSILSRDPKPFAKPPTTAQMNTNNNNNNTQQSSSNSRSDLNTEMNQNSLFAQLISLQQQVEQGNQTQSQSQQLPPLKKEEQLLLQQLRQPRRQRKNEESLPEPIIKSVPTSAKSPQIVVEVPEPLQ